MIKSFLITLLLLLGACTTIPSGQQLSSDGKKALGIASTVKSFSEASPLPLPVVLSVDGLSSKDLAFSFGDNDKAFFKLYRLPEFKEPYSITVTTHQEGQFSNAMLLIPNILFLDEGFNIKRTFGNQKVRNRGAGVELTVFINPSNSFERYVLIRGGNLDSSVKQSKPMVQTSFISTPYGTFMLTNGQEVSSEIYSSPVGQFTIEQRKE